ncbi:hypothetical protein GC176_21280 [bacterium]|nr:hypothetical protein [bacterium]
MQTIPIRLTVDEINLVLDALGYRPFREVFELMSNLQDQVSTALGQDRPGQQAPGESHDRSIQTEEANHG